MNISPIILNKLPFDAEFDCQIHFTYSGSQIFAYRIVVVDIGTENIVYDNKTDWQSGTVIQAIATVPKGILQNGHDYSFQLYVFDRSGNQSPASNKAILKALKTPIFTLTNIQNNDKVENSYLNVGISYEQENGELLNFYTVYLYSVDKNQIWSSGILYADNLVTQVSGLTDDTTYFVKATGETVNGLEIETEMVQFSCDYIKPDIFLKFLAENVPEEGLVKLSSNFILIEGFSDPEELTYIDGEKVSLLNGEKVWFDKGFSVKNWVCEIIVSNIPDFARFATFDLQNSTCYLTWNYGDFIGYDDTMYYVELTSQTYIGLEPLTYIQRSNRILKPEDNQQVFIYIKHVNGKFDLQIETLTEGGDA